MDINELINKKIYVSQKKICECLGIKYKKSGGRDLKITFGEIGLGGHWVKYSLHFAFLWKAKMKPFWYMIPE